MMTMTMLMTMGHTHHVDSAYTVDIRNKYQTGVKH